MHCPELLSTVPGGHRHPVTHSSVHGNDGPLGLSHVAGQELVHELHDPPVIKQACTFMVKLRVGSSRLASATPPKRARAETTTAAEDARMRKGEEEEEEEEEKKGRSGRLCDTTSKQSNKRIPVAISVLDFDMQSKR